MRLVIDASAVIAVLLDESLGKRIIKVTRGAEVISPATLPWEVGNALVANVRKKRLQADQAVEATKNFELMDIRLMEVNLEESVVLANRLNIYAYDAYVLCCAQSLKLPLLSLDTQMVQLSSELGIRTMEVYE